MSSSYPATSENGGHDDIEMANQEGRRSTKNIDSPVTGSWRRVRRLLMSSSCQATSKNGGHDDAIVKVARQEGPRSAENIYPPVTVGSNVPGGYWQDDDLGHHRAGEPIMRTQRFSLYMLFILSSWVGFASSMGLTLVLLTGMPPGSRFVRGLFVLSYSALILRFITQQAFSSSYASLVTWGVVFAIIAAAVNYRTNRSLHRFINKICREPVAETS